MYDSTSEPREFVGVDRQDAVAKACGFFQASEDQLEIHELDAKEIYGLASRAVVVAALLGRKVRSGGAPAGGDEPRGGRRDRNGGGRGREGRSGGRGERDRGGRREGRSPGRSESPRQEARAPREELPAEPSVGAIQGELGEVGRFVLGALERMRLGSFEISENADGGVVVIALRGAAAMELGRGDGRPVDALQMLANQAAMRIDENHDRVVLDVEGDLEERENRLSELADRAARRARETGRAIALDPMSPRDRRVVHLALREADGIATMSIGEGRFRQVVVVPEGAPEYEEAQRESRAASAADVEGE